jgi:hypothetical protein
VGTWSGWGKIFLLRKSRVVGRDRSERLHDSALNHVARNTRALHTFRA